MEEKLVSEGKCLFCGEKFSKKAIHRHIAKHLSEKVKTGNSGISFLVKIETPKKWGDTPYFLSLWIDGKCEFSAIDDFLRAIWLDCCGHMSAFSIPRKKTDSTPKFNFKTMDDFLSQFNDDEEEYPGEISMNKKAKDVLFKGLKLNYTYDFGSSTNLVLTVIEEYPINADEKVVLLSRNEPPEMMCAMCGKAPATQICTSCMYDGDAEFCDKCATKHEKKCEDFADYASMPVVNSPRMGVCGYTGGTIDTERD
jgi:hypothetical protein